MAMPPGFLFGGLPDRIKDATLAGGDWTAGMPVTKLSTAAIDQRSRSTDLNPLSTLANVTYDNNHEIRVVGLINNNLSPTATIRYIAMGPREAGASQSLDQEFERIAPDTLPEATNLTGAVTDIDDDPYSPDANSLSATDSNTVLRVTFPTPAANPSTGADLQLFRVLLTGTDASGFFTANVAMSLYESGSLVSALTVVGQSLRGQETKLFTAAWDATLLGTASGANVELRVVCSQDNGGLDVKAVDWLCEHAISSPTGGEGLDYDTGYVQVWPDSDSLALPGVTLSELTTFQPVGVLVVPEASASDHYLARFFIRDTANLDGYVEASRLIGGSSYVPTFPVNVGCEVGFRDLAEESRTAAGFATYRGNRKIRTLSGTFSFLAEAEALLTAYLFMSGEQAQKPGFIVIPRLEHATSLRQLMAFFAKSREVRPIRWQTGDGRIEYSIDLEEV